GPLSRGHGHPRVVRAVEEALHKGATFGAPTELETQLAELIVAAVPSIEMVRLVSSGTEASMSAIRLARGFTGRDVIIKFAGCYHGHVDSLLVAAGSSALTHGVPSSPGVPKGCTNDTLVLQYNDCQGLEDAFRNRGSEIAGPVYEAGTMSGNTLAMAAGIATLRELKENPPYDRLERLSRQLCSGISDAAKAAGHTTTLNRVGSMWTLFFEEGPITDYES